jgi:ubiquinol-cytochrome c reductase cytochrome b subunit
VVLFLLPWLDRSSVRSTRYKGTYWRVALTVFVISFVALGYLGTQPATPTATLFARIFTVLYFAFFLLMPWYSSRDTVKAVPDRVTMK